MPNRKKKSGAPEAEDAPEMQVGTRIKQWLKASRPSPEILADWLEGYQQPWEFKDEDPYESLVRGLKATGMLRAEDGKFCDATAALLREWPGRPRPEFGAEKLPYNLFKLAAALSCPRCLAEPLKAIYLADRVEGKWRGVDLRDALREALQENQLDATYAPLWRAMIQGPEIPQKDGTLPMLPGSAVEGFGGLLRMPPGPNHPLPIQVGLCLLICLPDATFRKNRDRLAKLWERYAEANPTFKDKHCEIISDVLFRDGSKAIIPARIPSDYKFPPHLKQEIAQKAVVKHYASMCKEI